MRKQKEVYLGDKIITTKKFKPLGSDGNPVDLEGALLEGVVVQKRGHFIGVDFGKEFPFTHLLDGTLTKPHGYAINKECYKVLESYSCDDRNKEVFVNVMREGKYLEAEKIPKQIADIQANMISRKNNIKDYNRSVAVEENRLLKDNVKLKELTERKDVTKIDVNKLEKQYDKLIKNSFIKEVTLYESEDAIKYILVTTEDLTFKDENKDLPEFNLGAYKIRIPLDSNRDVMAVNYKRHVQKKYFHPCISEGNLCLGPAMIDEVVRMRRKESYPALIHLLINFLREPSYNQPFLDARYFYCAQDVNIRPRNNDDWFNMDYWRSKASWDGKKYTEEGRDVFNKYTGRPRTSNTDSGQAEAVRTGGIAGLAAELSNSDF